jgi:iron complex outermembrane receptor protein
VTRFHRTLIASMCATALTPAALHAQIDTAGSGPAAVDEAETVIVTGTRRSDRTVAESPVPIDVIGGPALQNSGYTDTNRLLNQLVPSFNFPQPSNTDGTDGLRPATLRGLGPDQTLTLINGKRRHSSSLLNVNGTVGRGSAAVDLSAIPPIAIDRIEVLRDGASSQYGSDAIAGVINVILKRSEGGRAQVTFGKYYTDVNNIQEFEGLRTNSAGQPVEIPGFGGSVYDIVTSGKDRRARDGQSLTLAANMGLPIGPSGYLNVSAQFQDKDPTNRTGYDRRRQYPLLANGNVDPREFTFDRLNHRFGDPKTTDMQLFANGGFELSPAAELYGFTGYSIRDVAATALYRRAAGSGAQSDVRNCNFSSGTCVPFYADGFLPIIASEIQDYSAAVGVRGEVSGWKYDLSWTYGRNRVDFRTENSVNTSFGSASLRSFNDGGTRFRQHSGNLDIQRDVAVDFLSELSVAFGAEFRHENYKIIPGELQSYAVGPLAIPYGVGGGAQGFGGFAPRTATNASRHSVAGYVEVDADISSTLSVQLAGRYENFSDFGDTFNGKIAGRFAPLEWFAIRGSASTGFRAPSLQQQKYTSTSTNLVNVGGITQFIDVGTFAVSDPVARALGSRDLTPEKSTNLSAGVSLTPFRGLSLTADYYNIEIRDRVVYSENLQGPAVVALLNGAGFTGLSSARFFVNGIDTRTQGVEIVGSYRVPDFGVGDIRLTAGYNYNETKIIGRAVLPTLPGLTLFGRQESLRFERGQPKTKFNAAIDIDRGILGATVRTNRYGKVLSAGTTPALDVELAPKWITDLEVRVRPGRFELAVGANNLFDIYPTSLPLGPTFASNFYIPYSQFSPFGFNGRYLYARAGVKF